MSSSDQKNHTLGELTRLFGGRLVGDPDTRITHVATLDNAGQGSITFLANERYRHQLQTTRAAAVIVGEAASELTALPRIVCPDPYAYFARVSGLLNPLRALQSGRHPTAVIDATAVIASEAEVGPLVVIGKNSAVGARSRIGAGCVIGSDVVLGEDVVLHANVTVYDGSRVGSRVILHSGVVIGADGFGFALSEERWLKVPQIGRVVIGDDVEIGANTTVDCGAIEDTVIEEGAKLDNQIQIAHNVRIGAHTAIAACVGIAGSTRIGRHCRIGGMSGITGHLDIADRVEISAHTLITKSIDKPGSYTGVYPFDTNREWRANAAQLRHLGELAARVRELEQMLKKQNGGKS